jgi:general secretion pathway protein N
MGKATGILGRLGARKSWWIPLALVLWLIFVVSQIPAVWGAYAMTRSGQLALSGVSGTLWSGRASLASFKADGIDYSLGQLYWKLKPWSLLTLTPCADIVTELDRQHIEGEVCAGISGNLALRDATISAPAALLQPALPLSIDGQLSVSIHHMQVQGDYLQNLEGNLSWTAAQIHNGNNWMALGSYAAQLTDDERGGIMAEVFHLDGPTEIDLQVQLFAGGGGKVRGTFSMNPAFTAEIQADAWISMFAQNAGTDTAGNARYQVDMQF